METDIGADLAGAIAQMRGSSGSIVKLTVRRPAPDELLSFSLRRAKVEVHSVAQQTSRAGLRLSAHHELQRDDGGGCRTAPLPR